MCTNTNLNILIKNLFACNNINFIFSKFENIINNILIFLLVLFPILLISGPFLTDLFGTYLGLYFLFICFKNKQMKDKFKTPSKSSPRPGTRRGCLCENGTYSVKCCDGSLQAQGIGKTQTVVLS